MSRRRIIKKNTIIPDNLTIGFIVPICSRKRNYQSVSDTDFFKILVESFLKTYDKTGKYKYNFYLGHDNDDFFFMNNKDEMKRQFDTVTGNKIGFNMIEMQNLQGKVGQIWSRLADIASEECDYLYQIGDDIKIITDGWENVFVTMLLQNNNIGVTGPNDIDQYRILTQSFVHTTHLKIFGDYYPKEIENWYIDDWITSVYRPKKLKNILIKNCGGIPRYNVVNDKKNFLKVLEKSKKILEEYLNNKQLENGKQ